MPMAFSFPEVLEVEEVVMSEDELGELDKELSG